jgi:hypothetical protein
VGLFDHVPSDAVSVDPSAAVPLIVGGALFCGADDDRAAAAAARPPTAAKPSAAPTASFNRILIA